MKSITVSQALKVLGKAHMPIDGKALGEKGEVVITASLEGVSKFSDFPFRTNQGCFRGFAITKKTICAYHELPLHGRSQYYVINEQTKEKNFFANTNNTSALTELKKYCLKRGFTDLIVIDSKYTSSNRSYKLL